MSFIGRIILLVLVVLVEVYFFQAVNTISRDYSEFKRNIIRYVYVFLSAVVLLTMVVNVFWPLPEWPRTLKFSLGTIAFIILLSQVVGSVPLLLDDVIRGGRWLVAKIFADPVVTDSTGNKITRLKFLSYTALSAAALPGVGLLYGYFKGGYDYRVHKVKLSFPNLPDAFDGFKIVQLSDIHTGSFMTPAPLVTAFTKVMEQKPDAIFFTGDLVNDVPEETEGFEHTYKMLQAPHGVHSVFGNHDYAEYKYRGDEFADKRKAAQDGLKNVHKEAGWNLMMNQHTYLEKDGQKIGIIGVENWDSRGFSRYGDMNKAKEGMEEVPFKILLSHSPSHWEAQILKEHNDIDLTLSGHTHGMQLGVEIPGFKWSPVKYLYKQWAGLYHSEGQYLYVNRGLGFIGYNGRLGIWPEITVIELHKGPKKYAEA